MVRAIGGERSPVKERISARKKRIFARAGITGRKSMRAEANAGNGEFAECREIHPHFCRVLRYCATEITFLSLAAEARESQAFSLARAKPAAPGMTASQQAEAQTATRSESMASATAPAELLEHSERRELGESLVERKLRR